VEFDTLQDHDDDMSITSSISSMSFTTEKFDDFGGNVIVRVIDQATQAGRKK